MAVLNIPRKIRPSGVIQVEESMATVLLRIRGAKTKRDDHITLTERTNGKAFVIKHSFINAITDDHE